MFLLWVLSCAPRVPPEASPFGGEGVQIGPGGLLAPSELVRLMEASQHRYLIEEVPLGEAWTDLSNPGEEPPLADPERILVRDPRGYVLLEESP